jgi:glycosyltransferase involved in cell wall biosynthesis
VSRIYRLLHIIDHLGSGGAQEALLSLVKYCDRRRFHVEVATLHGQGHYWHIFSQLCVPVYSLSPHKYIPLYLPRLFHLLQTGKFDLIHCHLTASNLIAKPLAAILGVPLIFNYDQNDMLRTQQKARLLLDRLANLLTDHIIAVSASTRDFLIQQERVPADKITIIYNGVDLARFQPASDAATRANWRHKWGLPADTPVVAGVGRLRQQKNFPLFLRVAGEVLREIPQAGFVIAGEGPDRQDLEILARDLGIASQVHFLGYVSDMRELYAGVDLLLMTSLSEGTPLTVLEAMAMGVPVVATRVDGMAEVLEDAVDAYLVAPGDLSALAQRTCRLLQDQTLVRQFSRAGQRKVREHYSAVSMTQQLENIYLKYLQDRIITKDLRQIPSDVILRERSDRRIP